MKKPFLFTHMLISLDGKIIGNYMRLPEEGDNAADFRSITFAGSGDLPFDSWMCGRNTAEADFTYGKAPELDEQAPPVPAGDFVSIPPVSENGVKTRYLFVLDRYGKLGWDSDRIPYGEPASHVVEVLTEQASNAYKDFLRRRGVSYVICGEGDIDYEVLFAKMVDDFGIERLMTSGGSLVSWLMVKRGYADEVSFMVVPAADGDPDTPSMFMAQLGVTDSIPVAFELLDCRPYPDGGVWLHYKVKKVWGKEEYVETFGLAGKDFLKEANK